MTQISAELLPLDNSKYYGTYIKVTDEEDNTSIFKIWQSGGVPSERQLEQWGYTKEQYEKNELVPDGWDSGYLPIREVLRDLTADSHYETEQSYNIAKAIVDSINSYHRLQRDLHIALEALKTIKLNRTNILSRTKKGKDWELGIIDKTLSLIASPEQFIDPEEHNRQSSTTLNR